MAQAREQLRQQLRKLRRDMSREAQMQAAQAVTKNLIEHIWFQQAATIACYVAQAGELNTAFIIEAIWQQGKTCYLPVLDALPRQPLHFAQYQPADRLAPNRYGILEPHLNETRVCAAEALDLVLLPLVGFDAQGNRLGMGSGYYDRTFAFMKKWPSKKPVLLGLAYEAQQAPHLESAPWDVPLHGIVTEARVYLAAHSD